jgi:rsbT antagonist protein RsbS
MEPTPHGCVGVTKVRGTLVVTVTRDLGDDVIPSMRGAALEGVHQLGCGHVVLDLSGVPFLDLAEFEALRGMARSIGLLGASATVAGLRPGIIMHLMERGADTSGIRATLGLEEALELFGERPGRE